MARSQVLHDPQVFTARLAFRVEIGDLSNSNSPVATAWSKSFMVTSSRVKNTSVIPDSDIIRVIPLEADLQIMAVCDEIMEPLQHICAFSPVEAVDGGGK
jgi:hypothetical protein